MDWIWFTAVALVSRAVYGVLTKVLSNEFKVSTFAQGALTLFAAGVIGLAFSPLLGGLNFDFSKVSLTVVILVILGLSLGNILYFIGIKELTSGTTQIAFSSVLVFNTVLSFFFFSLHLSALNWFGLILLALAILSVTTGKVEFHKKGASLIVISALMFSVFQLASAKLSKQVTAADYLLISYFGAAIVIFLTKAKVVIKDLSNTSQLFSMLGLLFVTALPSVGYFLFSYYAYKHAPQPAKVAILLTAQVVVAVFLSYFFLKEHKHLPRKIVASILVVASAIMIKS